MYYYCAENAISCWLEINLYFGIIYTSLMLVVCCFFTDRVAWWHSSSRQHWTCNWSLRVQFQLLCCQLQLWTSRTNIVFIRCSIIWGVNRHTVWHTGPAALEISAAFSAKGLGNDFSFLFLVLTLQIFSGRIAAEPSFCWLLYCRQNRLEKRLIWKACMIRN